MLKKIFLSVLFSVVILNASVLNDKISNLIGENSYIKHKNLINYIFTNDENYMIGEHINYIEVIDLLQKNGLLNLTVGEPKDIFVKFNTNHDPIKSLKILKNTLKSLGFYYYFTKNLKYDTTSLTWEIRLKTAAAIDPLILANELKAQNSVIVDIKREGLDKWEYSINTANAKINNTIKITANEKKSLSKPLNAYILEVENISKLAVISKVLNNWFPNVVFYDKHLNILEVIKKDKVYRKLVVDVPENTKYIKVDDLYTLINIKRGLSIITKE